MNPFSLFKIASAAFLAPPGVMEAPSGPPERRMSDGMGRAYGRQNLAASAVSEMATWIGSRCPELAEAISHHPTATVIDLGAATGGNTIPVLNQVLALLATDSVLQTGAPKVITYRAVGLENNDKFELPQRLLEHYIVKFLGQETLSQMTALFGGDQEALLNALLTQPDIRQYVHLETEIEPEQIVLSSDVDALSAQTASMLRDQLGVQFRVSYTRHDFYASTIQPLYRRWTEKEEGTVLVMQSTADHWGAVGQNIATECTSTFCQPNLDSGVAKHNAQELWTKNNEQFLTHIKGSVGSHPNAFYLSAGLCSTDGDFPAKLGYIAIDNVAKALGWKVAVNSYFPRQEERASALRSAGYTVLANEPFVVTGTDRVRTCMKTAGDDWASILAQDTATIVEQWSRWVVKEATLSTEGGQPRKPTSEEVDKFYRLVSAELTTLLTERTLSSCLQDGAIPYPYTMVYSKFV